MNNLAPQFFVFIFCSLIMGFAAVSLLVAGIMIAANKLKQTKVLGISYIITGLSSLSVFVYNALLNFSDGGNVIVFGDAVMVFTMICVFASALCSCIYIHKNYGLKQIYVPVLLLPFVVLLADALGRGMMFCSNELVTGRALLQSFQHIEDTPTTVVEQQDAEIAL